jgi:hypothetical protein
MVLGSTYAVLSTAARLSLLRLLLGRRLCLLLGLLLGRLGLRLLLGRLGFRLLLGGLGLLLLLLLGLLLFARWLRRGLLVLGGGLLGLVLGLLLSTRGRLAAKLELDYILTNGDGVLLVDEKLLDGTGLRCVQRDVDLVGLDGGNLLVLLNVVADLCGLLVCRLGALCIDFPYASTTASGYPR